MAENKPKRRPRELAIAARGQARIEKKKVVFAISGPFFMMSGSSHSIVPSKRGGVGYSIWRSFEPGPGAPCEEKSVRTRATDDARAAATASTVFHCHGEHGNPSEGHLEPARCQLPRPPRHLRSHLPRDEGHHRGHGWLWLSISRADECWPGRKIGFKRYRREEEERHQRRATGAATTCTRSSTTPSPSSRFSTRAASASSSSTTPPAIARCPTMPSSRKT